jgi:hypothetical protein
MRTFAKELITSLAQAAAQARGRKVRGLRVVALALARGRTKNFHELVRRQVKADKKFAEALLREGIDAMLSGDVETGKTMLRDHIEATVGFEKLDAATSAPPKSLRRMFGPRGDPRPKILFGVIGYPRRRR